MLDGYIVSGQIRLQEWDPAAENVLGSHTVHDADPLLYVPAGQETLVNSQDFEPAMEYLPGLQGKHPPESA